MPRFFIGSVSGEQAVITGEDAKHMALSLRMKVGDAVTVCDSAGYDHQCVIEEILPSRVLLSVRQSAPSAGEPAVSVTLYQAMPKADKMESIIQKSVELGVGRIVPVLSQRCISRPDEKTMQKKLVRYNKIALEAAKQCGRGRVPEVGGLIMFAQAVEQMRKDALALFFYENSQRPLASVLANQMPQTVSLIIGSEGGFSPEEAQLARESGLCEASLGTRILRCETAPIAALAAMMYQFGEF